MANKFIKKAAGGVSEPDDDARGDAYDNEAAPAKANPFQKKPAMKGYKSGNAPMKAKKIRNASFSPKGIRKSGGIAKPDSGKSMPSNFLK